MMKLVLCGKTASGKTELAKALMRRGFKKDITCTTRPMRPMETDGVDYYFLTKRQFKEKIGRGEFVEHTAFNGWYYGVPMQEFESANVVVTTPGGVHTLIRKGYRDRLFIVLLDADDELLYGRLERRGDEPKEIKRRLLSDAVDFEGFVEFDMCIMITEADTIDTLDRYADILSGLVR